MVYLSTYLTPYTETFGDIELLRSVFRACMGRNVQLLFIAGPAGAEGTTGGCDDDATAASGAQTGKGIIARAANDLCRYYASRDGIQAKVLRVPYLYTASPALTDPFWCRYSTHARAGRSRFRVRQMRRFPCCVPRNSRCWCIVSLTAGMPTLRCSTLQTLLATRGLWRDR